jgi:hypothetical protein
MLREVNADELPRQVSSLLWDYKQQLFNPLLHLKGQ